MKTAGKASEAWREGDGDDLVLALALAVRASRVPARLAAGTPTFAHVASFRTEADQNPTTRE